MSPNLMIRAWYVSRHRILELIDTSKISAQLLEALQGGRHALAGYALGNLLGRPVLDWISRNSIQPFHKLAATGNLQAGATFYYQGHFYGKGFGANSRGGLVSLTEDVGRYIPGHRLEVNFSRDGIPTSTGRGELGGSRNLFALLSIVSTEKGLIRCVPYIIGQLIERIGDGIDLHFPDQLRVYPSQIDQFSEVDFRWRPSTGDMNALKDAPEKLVKEAICALLDEDVVPFDWPGEECDVFTSNLSIGGERISAAFLLKGPSRFHEMLITDCGKRGDQIVRLFNLPAELFIVQHCHKIGPAVRRTVEAFALSEFRRRCRYMLLDRSDTCCILKYQGVLPKKPSHRRVRK